MAKLPNRPRQILVMMPARNEQSRIGPVIRAVQTCLPDADVAVVNDDSADGTAQEALNAGAIILPHAVGLGYGAGLETGYMYALSRDYDLVVQMDSDGQHPAEEIPRLIAAMDEGGIDIVMGSRYLCRDHPAPTPFVRRLGQRFFALLLRGLTGRKFTDPTSGFQALSRKAIRFFASGVFPCDYPDADVLLMAHLAGLQIREVAVQMHGRAGGVSMHSGLKPVYYGMKMLLSVFVVLLNRGVWKSWRPHAGDCNR